MCQHLKGGGETFPFTYFIKNQTRGLQQEEIEKISLKFTVAQKVTKNVFSIYPQPQFSNFRNLAWVLSFSNQVRHGSVSLWFSDLVKGSLKKYCSIFQILADPPPPPHTKILLNACAVRAFKMSKNFYNFWTLPPPTPSPLAQMVIFKLNFWMQKININTFLKWIFYKTRPRVYNFSLSLISGYSTDINRDIE